MQLEVITRTPPANARPVSILCVHGGYHGAWCWDEHFLPYFAEQGYTACALSLRGHGRSAGHEQINKWRIADYVEDVATVVATSPQPPVLIGHSLGGVVVQKYLETHLALAGVLLASSPIQGMAAASMKMILHYPIPLLKTFLTFNMLHARPAFEDAFFSADMPRSQVRDYFARMGNESFRALLDIMMFDKPQPERIKTPLLVVGGERDSSIPRKVNEALARAYHTQLETFPVAHDMMLEAHWPTVAGRIVSWLSEQGL
ncbi:MAG: lysophospholipase [Chloroflexi bacterium]|nr:lysophospholipase [Chloroflexota bacterium]MCI0577580.1 lysophospholipase [Chloroflexota bacterium]MCI0644200.1 lysophospholipase [Chloroflexota bacterium]MCI0725217.1 lysophospholipase [Chloroflexota bacterium]